jgi:exopolysaccharide biosynthesis protein
MLLAWDKHDDFDFEFYDGSLRVAINSVDAAYIKSRIKPKILAASRLLCIVGKESSRSSWINWEIQTAFENDKKLIVVKIDKANPSPAGLMGKKATWALSFNFDAIRKAIDES